MNAERKAEHAAQDAGSQTEIDVHDRPSLDRWTQALGVTEPALLAAVQKVGRRIDRIKEYLGAGGMAGDQADG